MFTWNADPFLGGSAYPVRIYGLLLGVAVVSAFLLFRWQMMRANHPEAVAAYFLAYGLVGVFVGARLVHCLVYDLPRTAADPWSIVRPWEGGLSSHGALGGLALAVLVFSCRHRIRFAELADHLAMGSALGVVIVRIANFFNSEIVGRPTGATWGVRFLRWDGPAAPPRHPVQLYEAGLGLLIFAALWWIDRQRDREQTTGLLASIFLACYFGLRLLLEIFKEPEGLPSSSPITFGQMLSVLPALIGAVWLVSILRAQGLRRATARRE